MIKRVLGSSGFGITYLARDVRLARKVVIKENLPVQFCFRDTHSLTVAPRHTHGDDVENFRWSLENFSKEAAMLASLDHPGIVKVHRLFEAFGTAYFVMPFVEGVALDELAKKRGGKPFSQDELHGLTTRVLDALAYLHDRGIYHRDIKPANILITNEGIPVLIDFGSARQRLSDRSMTVIESAGYTPFEQLQSRGNVGPWSDLYALGGTLEKALTGEAPPKAMDRMRRDPRVPLAERKDLAANYSSDFLRSIDKALEVDEGERWQNAGEWLAALRQKATEEPPRAAVPKHAPITSPDVPSPAATGSKQKNGLVLWAVAACIVIGLVALAKNDSGDKANPHSVTVVDAAATQSEQGRARTKEEANLTENLPTQTKSEWLEHAGRGNAYAQALLARLYWIGGDETPIDRKTALAWAEKSANQNHPLGLYMMGALVESNPSSSKQETKTANAKPWYEKAAKAGLFSHPGAKDAQWMNVIGVCYAYGRGGLAQDDAETVKWFRKAADVGDARGMYNLGVCYENGRGGLAKDEAEAEAVKWYRKAADAGNATGMLNLGYCYANGRGGLAQDEAEAVKWYRKAAEAGDENAKKALGRIGK